MSDDSFNKPHIRQVIEKLVTELTRFEIEVYEMDDFKLRSVVWHQKLDGLPLSLMQIEVVTREAQRRDAKLTEEKYQIRAMIWPQLTPAQIAVASGIFSSYEPIIPYIDF